VRTDRGPYELLAAADRSLAEVSEADQRLRGRALAAKLLFEVLSAARMEARRNYVEPLCREVERLGRIVFGSTLMVDIDPSTLQIIRRHLEGKWLTWDQLSTGAREQLGILSRIACAALVTADGGAPLIIDDALGYSDEDRLERMGAVLNAAGRTMQVIVLTCAPARFRRIGDAHIIRLPLPAEGGTASAAA
jgi:hypothetical protein